MKLILTALIILAASSAAFAKDDLMPELKKIMKNGCSQKLDIKPACGLPNGTAYYNSCEKAFVESTAKKLASEYGAISPSLAVRFEVKNTTIDWKTVSKGWLSLVQKINGDKDRADVVVWMMSSPFHYKTGEYNPLAYVYARGMTESLSVNWATRMVDLALKEKLNLNPIYNSYLHYFFTGDSDEMLAFINMFYKNWPELKEKNEQQCKQL